MDPLTQVLLQRAQMTSLPNEQGQPQAQALTPVTPPNPTRRIPQKEQRFANAQAIMEAYRNNWSPNPIILQAQLK